MRPFEEYCALIEAALPSCLPAAPSYGGLAAEAALYSLLIGGKRLRPSLLLAACECVGGSAQEAMSAACAVECIHTYSLIHDDLPALDDDALRRGKPSCHAKYGEAVAILAGDGLNTHAFALLAQGALAAGERAERHVRALWHIASAAGFSGMVAGQAADIAATKSQDEHLLAFIHENKTAALIRASVLAGAAIGGADEEQEHIFFTYGLHLGLAFQVADDILDATSTPEELGKTPGKDARDGKLTSVSLFGLDQARKRAERESALAAEALAPLGERAASLVGIALSLAHRRR